MAADSAPTAVWGKPTPMPCFAAAGFSGTIFRGDVAGVSFLAGVGGAAVLAPEAVGVALLESFEFALPCPLPMLTATTAPRVMVVTTATPMTDRRTRAR